MERKRNWLILFMMTSIFCIGLLCCGKEVSATTTGAVPTSEGTVSWTLSDEGALVFSGNGTTNVRQGTAYGNWEEYWEDISFSKESVTSVAVQSGSHIYLDVAANMFADFSNCVSIDMTGFDTSTITNTQMYYMFENCESLKSLNLTGIQTDAATDMRGMFYGCKLLTKVDLSGFQTGNVTNMDHMFYHCEAMTTIDLRSFDTSKVNSMFAMFSNCKQATSIDVSSFNTQKVTNMSYMFADCSKLKSVAVDGFDTGNVTNMFSMFSLCTKLEKADVSGFHTGKVKNFGNMFYYCEMLETIDVSKFDTTAATSIVSMFRGCKQLKSINVSSFDTSQVTHMGLVFDGCDALKVLDISNFDTSLVTDYTPDLSCASLEKFVSSKEQNVYVISTDGEWWYDDDRNVYHEDEEITLKPGTTIYRMKAFYPITYKNTECAIRTDILMSDYTYGTKYTLPALESKCYIFDGWYQDEALTQKVETIAATTFGDLTFYAKWTPAHDVDRTQGKILVEPTEVKEGVIEYSCKNCDYTETEAIPKIVTEAGKITDETILDTKNDSDIAGSTFVMLQARADKTTKNSIRLKWNKVTGADGYKIYGNKCVRKSRYEYIRTISTGKKTSYTQTKLKKGTYYKYIIRAYKVIDGQEVTIAVSKTIHATTTGGKYGNAKSVKIKTDKKMKKKSGSYMVTIQKNKKYTIKASEVKQSKKINQHRKVAFESSDASIATVTQKGVVKGVKKGTCYIYAYAQNGAFVKVKVKVK